MTTEQRESLGLDHNGNEVYPGDKGTIAGIAGFVNPAVWGEEVTVLGGVSIPIPDWLEDRAGRYMKPGGGFMDVRHSCGDIRALHSRTFVKYVEGEETNDDDPPSDA